MTRLFFSFLSLIFPALVEAADKSPSPSFIEQMLPVLVIFFIFYILVLRPQAKRTKSQYKFIAELKRGDEVITSSGIFGEIAGITEQYVILKVDENTSLRILKTQVASSAQAQKEKK